jgi:cell wall-associated NlpC family hydrolase
LSAPDPRLNLYRPDLADIALRDRVEANRFAAPDPFEVVLPAAPLKATPDAQAYMVTELLFGEGFDVLEIDNGWAWGQAVRDRYVGYVRADALTRRVREPSHVVSVLRSYVFSGPDIKLMPRHLISMEAQVRVTDQDGKFAILADGGYMIADHLVRIGEAAADYVAIAEQFTGAPYLWGGRQSLGLDCSGLVQTALFRSGRPCPRDSDMQEAQLGDKLGNGSDVDGLRRGDLVFWRGHVGIMVNHQDMLHANAHHMMTWAEPVKAAIERIAEGGSKVTALKRLPDYSPGD